MNRTLALCIPAYNAAEFLPRLLSSALQQVIPFDQILVYDDCSTDKTAEVAWEYGATVVNGKINQGCSFAKNKLAEITSCEWIHFHDADDELLPNFTQLAHKWISKPAPPDVILFAYEWRDNDTNELLAKIIFDNEALQRDPIKYSILVQINPFCGVYNKEKFLAAGGYDLDPLVLYNEDVAMHCNLAIKGLTFSAEPEISIINYRVNNSMSSANRLKCVQAHFHVMRKNAEKAGHTYAKELAFKLWKNAGVAASHLDWDTARRSVQLAIQLNGKIPVDESKLFKLLCRIDAFQAVYWREKLIRLTKPNIRKY